MQLAKILVRSYDDAKMAHHEFLTPEHLLRAALEFPQVCDLLNICGGDIESIRSTLNDYINNQIPVLKDAKDKNNKEDTAPVETHSYQEIMNRAIYHCVSSEKDFVDITDVLISMLDETKNYCSYSLRAGGIDRLHLLEAISYINGTELSGDNTVNIGNVTKADETKVKTEPGSVKTQEFPGTGRKNILERYTVNLTSLAKEGKLEDIVGRQDELNRIIQILCRKSKNNPLYVGDPGVGKTALTDGLAIRIANGEVPDSLKEAQIFSLNISSLIAGTKFRGDFEERINKIVEELSKYNSPILFIDEIHAIVGSGNSGSGSMDAANILKPIFTSGKIRFIGTTTFEAYKKSFEKDRALIRRFQKIDIIEPDAAQTLKILKGLCKNYEEFHKVRYSEKALKTAVELSVKYLPERRLPDKAIDIIDEAGSFTRIYKSGGKAARPGKSAQTENSTRPEKSLDTGNSAYIPVSVSVIKQVTSNMARVPVEIVENSEKNKLRLLEQNLKHEIFGQDNAIQTICKAVKKAKAGFSNPERPQGCFLFVGPTGVGKTELAKCLAKALGIKLIRYDMSEYQEKHTVSRLIGAPPGYVGFEEGGLLTDAVRREPDSIILLDEFEKAHEDIFNVLLQVMDYGFLTDNQGRKADFRNSIIIMTSNAGARDIEKSLIGFGSESEKDSAQTLKAAVDEIFSPEFRNRLDAIIPFYHLDKDIICSIVKKEISTLSARLAPKKVKLYVTDACAEYLAESGYSREFGARNINRLIDEKISSALADEVLFGKLSSGGKVTVDLSDSTKEIIIKTVE